MGGVNETKELLWPSNFVSVIANDRNNVFKQNIRGIVQSKISKLGKRRYATKTFYSEFIFSYG